MLEQSQQNLSLERTHSQQFKVSMAEDLERITPKHGQQVQQVMDGTAAELGRVKALLEIEQAGRAVESEKLASKKKKLVDVKEEKKGALKRIEETEQNLMVKLAAAEETIEKLSTTVTDLNEKLRIRDDKNTALQDTNKVLIERNKILDQELKDTKLQLGDKNAELKVLQAMVQGSSEALDKKAEQVASKKKKLHDFKEQVTQAEQVLGEFDQTNAALNQENATLKEEVGRLTEEVAQLGKMRAPPDGMTVAELVAELERLRNETAHLNDVESKRKSARSAWLSAASHAAEAKPDTAEKESFTLSSGTVVEVVWKRQGEPKSAAPRNSPGGSASKAAVAPQQDEQLKQVEAQGCKPKWCPTEP